MQPSANNASAENGAVATALDGVIVRGEQNLLADTGVPGLAGARAALETFFYAFNAQLPDLYQRIWADDPLVQLFSPVAGLVRGHATIAAFSERMRSAPVRVQTVFEDIVAYVTPELVVFTGREHGAYTSDNTPNTPDREHEAQANRPEIRTISICIFRFIPDQGGWRQVYHSVTVDDADQLAHYQHAVRGA